MESKLESETCSGGKLQGSGRARVRLYTDGMINKLAKGDKGRERAAAQQPGQQSAIVPHTAALVSRAEEELGWGIYKLEQNSWRR